LPVPERMLRIYRNENNVTVAVLELIEAVLESEHFCGTHKRECCRDEQHDKPRFGVFVDVRA